MFDRFGPQSEQALGEMLGAAQSAQAKVLAAQSDREPEISPVFRSINQRPQPDGDADDPIK